MRAVAAAGVNGVYLGRDVVPAASQAVKIVLTDVAPRVLTWKQTAEAAVNILQRKCVRAAPKERRAPSCG